MYAFWLSRVISFLNVRTSDLNNTYSQLFFTQLVCKIYFQIYFSVLNLSHLIIVIFISHGFKLLHHIFHHRLAYFFELTSFKSFHSFLRFCYHFQCLCDLTDIFRLQKDNSKFSGRCSRAENLLHCSTQSCFLISYLTIRSIISTCGFLFCFLTGPEFHINFNSLTLLRISNAWASTSNKLYLLRTSINSTVIWQAPTSQC